jgi:tRNA/rRNA methyltransferase
MYPANLCVILVEPKGAANIGSVARAMKNFGFFDLRLVSPRIDHLSEAATNMAVTARDLLDKARIFTSLSGALVDCNLALGTTRRFGCNRDEFLHPAEAGLLVSGLSSTARAALVFGREDKGLKNTELDLCQRLITIPTHTDLPSMNLSQAVVLCLYEAAEALAENDSPDKKDNLPASGKDLESMFIHMQQTLVDIGFLNPQNPAHIMRSFRRILGRQGLNDREVSILRGLWSKVDWLQKERRKKI